MSRRRNMNYTLFVILAPLTCRAAIVSSCVYNPSAAEQGAGSGFLAGTKCKDAENQIVCAVNLKQSICELQPCCKWDAVPVGGASEVIVSPPEATDVTEDLCVYDPDGAELETGFAPGMKCKDEQEYCVSYKDKGGCVMFKPCCKWTGSGTVSKDAAEAGARRMSHYFRTWEDLQSSEGVEGLTWEVLQQRCEPGAGLGQSQGGYISNNQQLRDVLSKDWATVKSMSTAHLELVAHLDAIWLAGDPCSTSKTGPTSVSYDVTSLSTNTLQPASPVDLRLECKRTRGIQQDLLQPTDFNAGWNVQWTVSNDALGKTIQVGGRNSSSGLLKYTKLFGFYEGGDANEFRVDPVQLVSILTANDQPVILGESTGGALSAGSGNAWMLVGGMALILALVAVFFFARKRKKGDDSSSDEDGPE